MAESKLDLQADDSALLSGTSLSAALLPVGSPAVLAEFRVRALSGATDLAPLEFLAAADPRKRWRQGGAHPSDPAWFRVQSCRLHLAGPGRKSMSWQTPAGGFDWALRIQPSRGGGKFRLAPPWFRLNQADHDPLFWREAVHFFLHYSDLKHAFSLSGFTPVSTLTELFLWRPATGGALQGDFLNDPSFRVGDGDSKLRARLVAEPSLDAPGDPKVVVTLSSERSFPSWLPLLDAVQSTRISMRFVETQPEGSLLWHVTQERTGQAARLVRLWNEVAAPYIEAFPPIRAGNRESLIPRKLTLDPGAGGASDKATVEYHLRSPAELAVDPEFGNMVSHNRDLLVRLVSWRSQEQNGAAKLAIPLFTTTAGSALALEASKWTLIGRELSGGQFASAAEDIESRVFDLRLSGVLKVRAEDGGSALLRDGAFDFSLADQWVIPSDAHAGSLRLHAVDPQRGGPWWVTGEKASSPDFFEGAQWHPGVETLGLPVADVSPGGQDDVPGAEFAAGEAANAAARPAPAIIVPGKALGATGARYALRATEVSGWQRSAALTLTLEQFPSPPPADGSSPVLRRLVIIDPEPFLVAQVEYEPLHSPTPEEITTIAVRATAAAEGASWQIQDLDQTLRVILPPQGVGEQMEKGPIKDLSATVLAKGLADGALADFRYTAPTILDVEASAFEQRYGEAAWNLRRLFGWPGRRQPGAGLKRARFELLYGLSAALSAGDGPRGRELWLRVVEIFARIGAVPRPPELDLKWSGTAAQQKKFQTFWRDQRDLLRALRTRLAVLEVWDERQPEGTAVTSGLSFMPRVMTSFKPDGTVGPPRGAQLAFPLSFHNPADTELQDLEKNWHSSAGLKGGFHWGFESGNIYKEFWRNPVSTSGQVSGLRFSALGGWGDQISRFSEDKTSIEARVAMGRTHYYRLERIGRIGVFWNRAKHVILFERVAGRTRQFANEADAEIVQHAHAGRPILRKVREYVEILEKTRRFPDFPGVPAARSGFVAGVTFDQTIFPVKTSWGRDIAAFGAPVAGAPVERREGWEIPLWAEGCDAAVYPKPAVTLDVVVDPEAGDKGRQPQVLDRPQDLYFFTETTPRTTSDVYSWSPFPWVDFCPLPDPANLGEPAVQDDPDRPLADVEAVAAGFARCTFAVSPGGPQTSVTANRAGSPSLAATLCNVTMMRSAPGSGALDKTAVAAKAIAEAQGMLRELPGQQAPALRNLAGALVGLTPAQVRARLLEEPVLVAAAQAAAAAKDLAAQLGELNELGEPKVNEPRPGDIRREPPAGLNAVSERLWDAAYRGANGFYKTVNREALDPLVAEILVATDRADRIGTGAENWIKGEIAALRTRLAGGWGEWDASVGAATAKVVSGVDGICDRLDAEIGRLLNQPLAPFDGAEQALGKADERVQDARKRWERAKRGLDEAVVAGTRSLDQAEKTLGEQPKLKEAVNRVRERWTNGVTAVGVIVQRIGDGVNAAGTTLATYHADLRELREAAERTRTALRQDATEGVATVRTAARQAVKAAEDGLATARKSIADLLAATDAALATLAKGVPTWGAGVKSTIDAKAQEWRSNAQKGLEYKLVELLKDGVVGQGIVALGNSFNLGAWLEPSLAAIKDALADGASFLAAMEERCNGAQRVVEAVNSGNPAVILGALEGFCHDVGGEAGRLGEDLLARARPLVDAAEAAGAAVQEGAQALRTVRALCDSLTAPGLGFNRKTVALLFRAQDEIVKMTPCVARLRELGDKLEALGLRVPTDEIGELLKPMRDKLAQFDFGKIMSDVGGLNLDRLLPGLKMPEGAADQLRVTHGLDRERLRAWAKAEADVPLPGRQNLFSLGPVSVTLVDARFSGSLSIEAELEGASKQTSNGQLLGTWELGAGGTAIVSFVDTAATLTDGRLSFDLRPECVRLNGALQMISDISQTVAVNDPDSGFTLGLVKEGEIPVGARAVLELPPIEVGAGTTSITGLQIGGYMELRALSPALKFDFSIAAGFHFGRKSHPFNLAAFILGGGGWVEMDLYYAPSGSGLSVHLSLGVEASATLALNLGFLRGSIGVYLGIFASYDRQAGQGDTLSVGVMLLFRGEVDVLGIISASMSLLLEAIYETGPDSARLIGRGTFSISIRICWCFTLEVSESVEYTFSGPRKEPVRKSKQSFSGPSPAALVGAAGVALPPGIAPAAVAAFGAGPAGLAAAGAALAAAPPAPAVAAATAYINHLI